MAQVDAELLTTELEALGGASEVDTSLWEASCVAANLCPRERVSTFTASIVARQRMLTKCFR